MGKPKIPQQIITSQELSSVSVTDESIQKLVVTDCPNVSALSDLSTLPLSYLDISKCSFESLPSIPQSLRVLKISHNCIKELSQPFPPNVLSLVSDHNNLSTVNFSGSKKSSLSTLILSHNKFTSIDIPKYHYLAKISLGHNQIVSFTCAPLLSLRELRLGYNLLTEIPACISRLTSLEILCLRGNLIQDCSLSTMEKCFSSLPLRNLSISGNPGAVELGLELKTVVMSVIPTLIRLDDKPLDQWAPGKLIEHVITSKTESQSTVVESTVLGKSSFDKVQNQKRLASKLGKSSKLPKKRSKNENISPENNTHEHENFKILNIVQDVELGEWSD
ncbi:hypothetical protein GEMRC1_012496 [Eukaryota sp. GEM-RC1]